MPEQTVYVIANILCSFVRVCVWIVLRFELDGLCGEVESEAQRLLDLLVLPPRDAVGRELQGYDHRRERQHVQFFLRRVQDGQGRLQHAWSMERLRLRRIIEISTCERDSQQVKKHTRMIR